jgi:tetratricopeptide (TPR) repeat protein
MTTQQNIASKKIHTVIAAIASASAAFLCSCHKALPPNPDLGTPKLAIEALDAKTPYFNPVARAYLLTAKPGLLTPDDRDEQSGRARAFAEAAQNPTMWRQLDRKLRFDAVLLSGDPALYRPLLQHLLTAGDWTLAYLDHTSFILKRAPAKAWSMDDLESLRQRFADLPAPQRAEFLVQVASKLLAANNSQAAKQQLDEALHLDDRSPAAWTEMAVYHVQLKQLPAALGEAEHALAIDAKFRPALETKAQVLLSLRRFNDAYAASTALLGIAPRDPSVLFLHAKICHEAHAYGAEIEALKKLIEIVKASRQSVTPYRIYLGQAYAEKGDAALAIEQFQQALAASDIDEQKREFLESSIKRIKLKSGL